MAERPDAYDKDPEDVKNLLATASDITQEVLTRLQDSAKRYGASYILADIAKELDAEILDIVGWSLLEATRMRLILTGKLATLDEKYLDKFLAYHDDDYLGMLRDRINEELANRTAD